MPNNNEHKDDFLRELLGEDLYSELKEDEVTGEETQAAGPAAPELPIPQPEEDVKIYTKDDIAKRNPSLRVEYLDDEKLSFITELLDDGNKPEDEEPEPQEEEEDEPRAKMPQPLKSILFVLCVLAASALLALAVWVAADDVLGLTGDDETVSFTVTDLDTMTTVSKRLAEVDLIKHPLLFRLYGWFSNADEKIESGTFELNKMYDYRALVVGMINYQQAREVVTVVIPEGFEQEQIFSLLQENGVASVSDLSQTAANHEFDYDFLIGLEQGLYNRLEGYLFPDTYDFYVDEDPVSVINKFLANFDRRFDEDLRSRIDVLNEVIREKILGEYGGHYPDEQIATYVEEHMLDLHDIVIIASLIEKEAANNSERSRVSSVIHNRLISMVYPTLRIDATIQYVLAERKEVLTYNDLSIDSPYNTYNNAGLPIGPIANPGLASIRAALYPDETDYYFYALDVDGTHHFSRTSEEHTEFLLGLEEAEENGQ